MEVSHGSFHIAVIAVEKFFIRTSELVVHMFLMVWLAL